MKGLIYDTDDGRKAFIPVDTIVRIGEKPKGAGYLVWFAKGYTNADATLSKDELRIRDYEEFVEIANKKG